jgi:hypothetical protein
VPRLHGQFRVLAKTHRLPSRCENFVEHSGNQIFIDGFDWNAIDAGAQRLVWHEVIRRVRRIDENGLRRANTTGKREE